MAGLALHSLAWLTQVQHRSDGSHWLGFHWTGYISRMDNGLRCQDRLRDRDQAVPIETNISSDRFRLIDGVTACSGVLSLAACRCSFSGQYCFVHVAEKDSRSRGSRSRRVGVAPSSSNSWSVSGNLGHDHQHTLVGFVDRRMSLRQPNSKLSDYAQVLKPLSLSPPVYSRGDRTS